MSRPRTQVWNKEKRKINQLSWKGHWKGGGKDGIESGKWEMESDGGRKVGEKGLVYHFQIPSTATNQTTQLKLWSKTSFKSTQSSVKAPVLSTGNWITSVL